MHAHSGFVNGRTLDYRINMDALIQSFDIYSFASHIARNSYLWPGIETVSQVKTMVIDSVNLMSDYLINMIL